MKRFLRGIITTTVCLALAGISPIGSAQQRKTPASGKQPAKRAATQPAPTQRAAVLSGYSPQAAKAELELERKFAAIPSAEEARRHHQFLTSEPHPAGSERNNLLARHIAELWKLQGWEDVVIRRYDVLQSSPREVAVEMVAPVPYKAALREDPFDADPDTNKAGVSGAYLGFSASGDVTAPLVYANSGNPTDYELLRKNGIDVKGKIVLVRYSNPYSYRGFKALTAQREGAAALLIYSDPMEDGYKRGKVYPYGPWGPESHIQRGAITYDFIVPGDPLTPGWASLPDAKRIPIEQAQSVPKIVAVPLSWRDAKPLLEHLDGPLAPKAWQGGLPIKYRLGGNAVRVHVKADMDTSVVPNYVVEGRLRGSELPDEWIVLGNHRDAWVFGGVDPSSGTASQLELTRALGELKKLGLRPKRTIVMCSWDGEEYGLTGSTEWGEQFADELRKKAVAYVNVDSSTSGKNFDPAAVPSLAPVLIDISKTLNDPSGKSLYTAWRETSRRRAKKAAVTDADLVNTRIGSGSDHTVFLNYDGVPSVLLSFEGPYGVYHSMYDDHFWMEHFGDPGFKYHALMSQFWGVLALRLANADVLPFDFANYAAGIRQFLRDLEKANRIEGQVDLQPLEQAVGEMQDAGNALKREIDTQLAQNRMAPNVADELSRKLMAVERNWLHAEGIPGRPWFKHLLYAARYTYAHLELPGLTEAVEAGDWPRAKEQAAILADAVVHNTRLLREALESLGGAAKPQDRGPRTSERSELKQLTAEIEAIRKTFPGEIAVYMNNLATHEEIALDADRVYETFSVIKVPIMAEVLRQAEEGKFSLSDRVELKAGDARWPSGVLYAMEPGLRPTIRDLLTLMIIISDNAATDLLADKVGRANVTMLMRSLGLEKTTIEFSDVDWDRVWLGNLDPAFRTATNEGVMKFAFGKFSDAQVHEAFRKAIYESSIYFGHSTARETGKVFELMARGELVSKTASERMLSVLRKQQVNNRFPRYLRDVEIAHKTGDGQPFIANDAGILWVNSQPIVLVVFTGRHRGETAALHDAVARVAALVGRHYGARLASDFREN